MLIQKRIRTPGDLGVPGGGAGGPRPPLDKLVSLAGQIWELGRIELGAW